MLQGRKAFASLLALVEQVARTLHPYLFQCAPKLRREKNPLTKTGACSETTTIRCIAWPF